jgi:soluble lytic murein transglycosylase-like protein
MLKNNIPIVHMMVKKWAPSFPKVPIKLVMSIIGNESGFNANATNLTGGDLARGGAWGLGQITLATANGIPALIPNDIKNGPVFKHWTGSGKDLLDPSLNVLFMMAYLNHLLEQLQGDSILATAAYNRGLGSVKKMVAQGRHNEVTQLDYVRHVQASGESLTKEGIV